MQKKIQFGEIEIMTFIKDLFTNPFIMTPVLSWLVAQFIKMLLHSIERGKLTLSRMHGDGGMPSCHAATVSALGFYCLFACGAHSFQFAVTLILAIVVCHDAMGVRQESGKHAEILNRLMDESEQSYDEYLPKGKLNEFVGHNSVEVFAGVGVGLGMALLMYFVVF